MDRIKDLIVNEAEYKPNKASLRALKVTILIVLINFLLTVVGIFRVGLLQMTYGTIVSLIFFLPPVIICTVDKEKLKETKTKYMIIACAIGGILVITSVMYFHTIPVLFFPMLLGMIYKKKRVGWVCFIGSMLCAVFSPVIGFWARAWDSAYIVTLAEFLGFESNYIEIFYRYSTLSTYLQILLYISLPQAFMVIVISFAMFAVIKNGEQNLINQITVIRNNDRVTKMQTNMLNSLAEVIESRDGSTGEHIYNTKEYVRMMVEYILDHHLYSDIVNEEYADILINSSILHDIGKISIPDNILNKPGKYTKEEYEVMKTHTTAGKELVEDIFKDFLSRKQYTVLKDAVYCHHERYDGTGYPNKLKGEDIPLAGRIVAVCDVFDALTSKRVYKDKFTIEESYKILMENSETQFDSNLVGIFIQIKPQVIQYLKEQEKRHFD